MKNKKPARRSTAAGRTKTAGKPKGRAATRGGRKIVGLNKERGR